MKKLIIEKTFNLAIENHKKGNFKIAENLYKRILNIYPDHPNANNNLGILFKELGKFEMAITCYKKVIEINPNHANANYNFGNLLRELGDPKRAIIYYKKAIEINPNYVNAYNNLGSAYKDLKDFKNSIFYYKKSIINKPNHPDANYNLGIIFKSQGNFKKAIDFFLKCNSKHSRAELLECIYFLHGLKNYKKMLKKIKINESHNIRVAAMASYVAFREKIENIYPFCKNPINFVFIKNIKNKFTSAEIFSEKLLSFLTNLQSVWEPSRTTTKGGYQTFGNLFNENCVEILKLKKIIEDQVKLYRVYHKKSDDLFIKNWPTKSKIHGWHVKLIKQGHQESHIHPAGWLSGVFYLKIPKVVKNEGSIKLILGGYDYPKVKKLPNLIHSPKAFDIVLFPSSLFHQTIPFNSNDERHSIAFDILPN